WVLPHAEIVVRAPDRDLARAHFREMVGRRKEPAAALQICKHAIATFSMEGLEALLQLQVEIHSGLLHVFQACVHGRYRAFRPSSTAAAFNLPVAAASSAKTSSALR